MKKLREEVTIEGKHCICWINPGHTFQQLVLNPVLEVISEYMKEALVKDAAHEIAKQIDEDILNKIVNKG